MAALAMCRHDGRSHHPVICVTHHRDVHLVRVRVGVGVRVGVRIRVGVGVRVRVGAEGEG